MTFRPRNGRRAVAGSVALAVCLAAGAGVPAAAQPAPDGAGTERPPSTSKADIERLDAELDAVEAAVAAVGEEVFQASGRLAGVLIEIDEAAATADESRDLLTDRVREIYKAGRPDPVSRALLGLGDGAALRSVAAATMESDKQLIAEVEREARRLDALRHQVAADEVALKAKVRKAEALEARLLQLLGEAEKRYAADQTKLAEIAARRQALAEQKAKTLAAREASAPTVLRGVVPAVTARGQRAASAEAPIIALLEAAGPGMPPGYRATGRVITGKASWYGPGFYGRPTATGAPYDAERYTCAMLAVPLGTVVRVTTDDGRAINVLVNDRGPYIAGRVIDMSEAGARVLGYSGVRQVSVEVLEPVA